MASRVSKQGEPSQLKASNHVLLTLQNIVFGTLQLAFHQVADKLDIQPSDIIFQSDTDELPTAAALLTARNILVNGLSADDVAIPVVDLHMQGYSLSLSHFAEGPVSCVAHIWKTRS